MKSALGSGESVMIVFVFLFGAAIGSFLNVVIHRLPSGETVLSGRSKCPSCGAMIRAFDNIPFLSYLLLKGKCRNCHAPIPVRYPLVELLASMVVTVNYLLYGISMTSLWASSFLLFLIPMAFIDATHYLLPNELTIGGFILGIIISLAGGPVGFKQALIGSVLGGGSLLLVSVVGSFVMKREAMGEGDIKMMAMIGAYLGWKSVLLTIFVGSAFGTLVFGPISLRKKVLVPFGVFLAFGGFISLYFGESLIDLYLGIFR